MKKPLSEHSLIEALELVAAHFQWQRVQLEVNREPDGTCKFSLWAMPGDTGWDIQSGHGATPLEAAQDLISKCPNPTPESMKEKAIRELEAKLEKLKAVTFGLPPYKPGTYLAENVSETIEI